MNSLGQSQPPSKPLVPHSSPPARSPRFANVGIWLGSCIGRVVIPGIAFIFGISIGVAGVILYILSIAGEGQVVVTPLPPAGGDIIVQVSPAYVTNLLNMNLRSSGLPGNVKNVGVMLADSDQIHRAQMTISGSEQISGLGIGITSPFTVVVQPYIDGCQLKVNVLHADFSGITVTSFAATFESRINEQLAMKSATLPAGFQYCLTNVRTKPQGLFLTYSATPLAQ
jgi:hypothetical protein